MNNINIIKKEIAKGSIKNALNLLLNDEGIANSQFYDKIILISLKYELIMETSIQGTVKLDEYQIAQSQIGVQLLLLLERMNKNKEWLKQSVLEVFCTSLEITRKQLFFEEGVSAGHITFAEGVKNSMDLNLELIRNPSSTFYIRVNGDSMKDLKIHNGNLLIVDSSLPPQNGDIAVCGIDGECTVKQLKIEKDCCWLIPANEDYEPIKVDDSNNFIVYGIVTSVTQNFY